MVRKSLVFQNVESLSFALVEAVETIMLNLAIDAQSFSNSFDGSTWGC